MVGKENKGDESIGVKIETCVKTTAYVSCFTFFG